jgi:hypothetical protein
MTSGLQVQLTGVLPFVVLLAVLLAFPVSLILLRLYRKAVIEGMARHRPRAESTAEPDPPRRTPRPPLRIHELTTASTVALPTADRAAYDLASRGLWRGALAYAIGGVAYALVMTAGWLAATHDTNLVWIKLLILFWTYCWPAVLAMLLVAGYDRFRRLQILGGYFAVLVVLMTVAVARNPTLGIGELPLHGSSRTRRRAFCYSPFWPARSEPSAQSSWCS